jgi:hypothetical protein
MKMKLTFTEEHIKNELNKFYLEEDDLMMEGEYITGEGKNYIISGVATIEGERYHEFEIEFELLEEPAEETIEAIMAVEWDWYDFLC